MNWGKKLMIAMALFMAFIISLGVNMIFSNNDDLIEEDYYEKGLNYDKTYQAKKSAVADSVVPFIDVNEYGLNISFTQPARCKLRFKRLSDSKMDTTLDRATDEDFSIQVYEGDLESGPWQLTIDYSIDESSYILERDIMMP